MEDNYQGSVDVINESISFSFTVNSNYQNDKCSVHEFLRDVPKNISDQENDFDKIAVFKIFCNDNIVIFSAIENSFSKKNNRYYI